MRTTVDIDPDLLEQIRAEAQRQKVPFKEYLNRVLRRGVAQGPPSPSEPYRCPAFSLGTPLQPLDKALAIADEER